MTIKLYYSPGACSLASHIALEEVGIAYETQRIRTAEGEQRSPEYLAINPRGRVPALVVDGKVMTENVGIMAYVAGGYGQGKIWPKDTWQQAKCIATMAWLSNTVHPSFARFFRTERYIEGAEHVQALKDRALSDYNDCLAEIDRLLDGRRWSIGNRYSVVDGYLVVFYRWGNRAKLPMASFANYTRVIHQVAERAAVKKVLADEGITLS
ncbi:MAG TPA: glutathione S-transferase N-terminal domain-containing protein [Usitatibacter sp.]|nr:glutathione S-transferase N-terminal domain-containing protein [Usitatibacter sp.]